MLEVLVKPFEKNAVEIAQKYKNLILNSNNLYVIEITEIVIEEASKLRAKYKIKTPDAIQIAAAILYNVDLIISNDKELEKINEVKIVSLDNLL